MGLIIRQRKGPVGRIEDIPRFIANIRSQLKDQPATTNDPKTYCMIVGDYGGPLAFTTEPPFCTAYPLCFANRDDPTRMTFRHPQNHPWYFPIDALLVRQLLVRDSSAREHVLDKRRRRILIPRGVHLSSNVIPEIEVPRCHSAPYYNHQTGVEAPFFTMGPFARTDTLFPGAPRDLDLYTDMGIFCLKNIGCWSSQSPAHEILAQHHLLPRQRQPHPSRSEKTKILRIAGVLLVRRPEVAKTLTNLNMNVKQSTNDFARILMLNAVSL